MFQFTHPGRGATPRFISHASVMAVSIHAPREGCDRRRHLRDPPCWSFNSRIPGGVRHGGTDTMQGYFAMFQFTHPGRGATTQYT